MGARVQTSSFLFPTASGFISIFSVPTGGRGGQLGPPKDLQNKSMFHLAHMNMSCPSEVTLALGPLSCPQTARTICWLRKLLPLKYLGNNLQELNRLAALSTWGGCVGHPHW